MNLERQDNLVLLTGATGFVGRQVLKALRARGVKVRLIVRERNEHLIEPADHIESICVISDLFGAPQPWLEAACHGVSTVIHVAWYAEPGKYLTSPKNLDCLSGTLALAKACVHTKIRNFVGIGTCFEYDCGAAHQRLTITTPLKPQTPYAAAKAAAYMSLSQYFAEADVLFAWARLFYLYGEGEDERRLIPYLRSRLSRGMPAELTSGRQVRDFMDVQEAGRTIVDIAIDERQGAINVCTGQAVTVKALAVRIADEYGRRDLLHFGARPDNLVDPPRVVGAPGSIR